MGSGADQECRTLAAQQFFGDTHGVTRIAVVVAAHDLDLAAQHAAGRIDLLHGQLDSLLVRFEEGRKHLVAVEFADLDRWLLGSSLTCQRERDKRCRACEQAIAGQHEIPLSEAVNSSLNPA